MSQIGDKTHDLGLILKGIKRMIEIMVNMKQKNWTLNFDGFDIKRH